MTESADSGEMPAGLLEVGVIAKPHGLQGELVVKLITDRTERLSSGSELWTGRGPLRVVSSRPHQDRWLVTFAGVNSREAAESWSRVPLLAAAIDDPDALFIHELIGLTVIDAAGVTRGSVVEVQANPASDLLVLDTGALVPLTFAVGQPDGGVLRVDTPDGLFELFE